MSLEVFSVSGKTILVTGSSSGIGQEIARQLDRDGAKLILIGRSETSLHQLASNLKSDPILIIQDLSKTHEIADLVKTLKLKVSEINGFVHSAGVSPTKPLNLVNEDLIRQTLDINLTAAVMLSKHLVKHYKKSLKSIVYISSVMSFLGEKAKSVYSLSKGALVAFSKGQALEYVKHDIRVNCVAPSVVETPLTENAVYKKNSESLERALSKHPLGFGKPEDVAYSVVYLLSDASKWVTGTNLIVDGGYSIQ